MLIKFLHSITSSEGWAHPPGKPVDFHDDDLARKFIASGLAVSLEPPAEPDARTAKKR
jgi:hypothetical protein